MCGRAFGNMWKESGRTQERKESGAQVGKRASPPPKVLIETALCLPWGICARSGGGIATTNCRASWGRVKEERWQRGIASHKEDIKEQ